MALALFFTSRDPAISLQILIGRWPFRTPYSSLAACSEDVREQIHVTCQIHAPTAPFQKKTLRYAETSLVQVANGKISARLEELSPN
jgi:hypothetical protein